MTPRDLMAAFEVLADAPDGVKRLRELVLQLAVRGKLVAQLESEGAGDDLLSRIEEHRVRANQRVAKSDEAAKVEPPFELPATWSWVRFGDIFDCRLGKMLDKGKNSGQPHRYLRNANVRWGSFDLSDVYEMRLENHELPEVTVRRGDLVVCEGGEPGRAAVWDNDEPFVIQKALHRARPRLVDSRFYQIHLRLDCSSGRLSDLFTGATIKHLTGQALTKYLVVLPPLAEQHRIVARVDELMALLDRLEATRKTSDEVRRAARDAALAALRDAPDPEAVEASWNRIAHDMDALFTEPEDVSPLRQAIRQLAVAGALTGDDVRHWASTTLGAVLVDGPTNGWSPKAVDHETPIKTLKLSATTKGYFDPTSFKYVEVDGDLDTRLWLKPEDLLIQRSNTPEYVGTSAVFDGPPRTFIYPDLMMRCRVAPAHDVRFVHLSLSAPDTRAWIRARASGTSQSMVKVNQGTVSSIPLNIPSRETQRRIVAKVDELMALCDDLEARLIRARELQAQFAEAAVHHLEV